MKNLKPILITICINFLFFSCSIIPRFNSFGKIFHEEDTYINQKSSFVRFVFDAKPLTHAFAHNRYTQLEFLKMTKDNTVKFNMALSMRLDIDEKIEPLFFLKTDKQLFEMHFDSIQYHKFHEIHNSTSSETTTTKESDKEKKSITKITHTVNTNEYDYNKVRTNRIQLQDSIIRHILFTEKLLFRYYIKEQAYSYQFSQKEMDTIKMLLKVTD
ncbi:MAG TPA: hypothetical protein EYG92_05390 [Lutibacter sp.]|nr:hypothetical protein [Lutibacter sp.]